MESSTCSFVGRSVCRCSTHQEDTEMREVITAAACLRRRNTVGFTAVAVPAALTIWQRQMRRHISRLQASCVTLADRFTSAPENNKSLNSAGAHLKCNSQLTVLPKIPEHAAHFVFFLQNPDKCWGFGVKKPSSFLGKRIYLSPVWAWDERRSPTLVPPGCWRHCCGCWQTRRRNLTSGWCSLHWLWEGPVKEHIYKQNIVFLGVLAPWSGINMCPHWDSKMPEVSSHLITNGFFYGYYFANVQFKQLYQL